MSTNQTIKTQLVTFKVFRFNIETDFLPYYETYELEVNHEEVVLDILNRLKWEKSGSLSYRRSCRHGICGSCSIKVNNKAVLACKENMFGLIELFGNEMTLLPLSEKRAIKDFIIDKKDFWDKHDAVKPYLISEIDENPDSEHLVSPESVERHAEADLCIQCGSCHYACPAIETNDEFFGPAAFVKAYRFASDVRDDAHKERLDMVNAPGQGVWDCMKCFECAQACPKDINPIEKITKLHNRYFQDGVKPVSNVGTRHAEYLVHTIKKYGYLNEAGMVIYAERAGVIKHTFTALGMMRVGKLPLIPMLPGHMPKSKNLDEIKTLIDISHTSKL